MKGINQPFTNAQLEILKVFSHDLSTEELVEFKNWIAAFFVKKAIGLANKAWDENGWKDEDVDRLLNTKLRKPKN